MSEQLRYLKGGWYLVWEDEGGIAGYQGPWETKEEAIKMAASHIKAVVLLPDVKVGEGLE